MKSLALIRHGQSVHHVKGLIGGWADFELTSLGKHQAACLAGRLKGEVGDSCCRLHCSDLKRARQTAAIIGRALGVRPEPHAELREIGAGVVEGKTEAEARQQYIAPTEPLLDWQPHPGAETWRKGYGRVCACVERLVEKPGDWLVLVTHKIPVHFVVAWWLGLDIERQSSVFFQADPASLTVLRLEEWGGHTVERLNDTAHLCGPGMAQGNSGLDKGG